MARPSTGLAELLSKVSKMESAHLGLFLLILLDAHLWSKAHISLETISAEPLQTMEKVRKKNEIKNKWMTQIC